MRQVLQSFAGCVITMTSRLPNVLLAYILLVSASVSATEGTQRSQLCVFLEALGMVESNGKDDAVGDGGHAIGRFQVHEAIWLDITAERKRLRLPVYSYFQARQREVSVEYANTYFEWLDRRFLAIYGRLPNDKERLLTWQLGLRGATILRFDITKAKPHNRRAYKKLQLHISSNGKPKHKSGASGDRIEPQATGERQQVRSAR